MNFLMTFFFLTRIILRMGNLKYRFPTILILVGILFSILLMENVGFFTNNPTGTLSNNYFALIMVGAAVCFFSAYIFEHVLNKTKVDLVLLTWCLAFLIIGLLGIIFFQDYKVENEGMSTIVSVTAVTKARYASAFTLFIISLYSLFFIISKNMISPKRLLPFYVIVIGMCFISIGYSLVTEIEKYKEIFTEGYSSESILSFYWNTNMMAGTMLMGMAAATIINIYAKKPFSKILILLSNLILYFFLVVTYSVLSILCGTTLLLFYFIYEVVMAFKKSFNLGYVSVFAFFVIVTATVCVIACGLNDENMGVFHKILTHIQLEFTRLDYLSFSHRTQIWDFAFTTVIEDPSRFYYGFGFGISRTVINEWSKLSSGNIASTHNGYVQIIFNYGVLGLILYGLYFLLTVYATFRLLRRRFRFAVTFLFIELIFLFYAMGESVIFFNSNAQGVIVGVLFYLPVLIEFKAIKYQKRFQDRVHPTIDTRLLSDKLVVKTTTAIILSLIVALFPITLMSEIKADSFAQNILYTILICLGATLLFLPYLVYLWHNNTTLKNFKMRILANTFLIILIMGLGVGFYYAFIEIMENTFIYVFPSILGATYVGEVIYYSIEKKPSFKAFIITFSAIFVTFLAAIIATVATTLAALYLFEGEIGFGDGVLKYEIIFLLNIIIFYVFAVLFMIKDTKAIIDYFEMRYRNSIYATLLKEEYSKD